jgi:DNA replication protein DnaC
MKDFKGPEELKKVYDIANDNLSKIYEKGDAICLAGPHGIGKSMCVSNILKKACEKNYECLYTTLSDMVISLIDAPYEEKFYARKELIAVDFLVIDEMDGRFCPSERAAETFGIALEHIFRTRTQNKLPIIICSNSPNPIEMFSGALKESVSSLMSRVVMVKAFGKDYRKEKV